MEFAKSSQAAVTSAGQERIMLKELFRRKSVERILRESEEGRMQSEHGGSLKRALGPVDLGRHGVAGPVERAVGPDDLEGPGQALAVRRAV